MRIVIIMLCIFTFSGVHAQSPVYPVRDASMNLGSGSADVLWFPYTPVKKNGSVFEMYYTWDGIHCYATSPTGKDWTFRNFVTAPSNESIIKKNNTWYMGYHYRSAGRNYFNTTQSSNGINFPTGVSRAETGEDMSFILVNDSFYCYIRPHIPNVDPLRKIGLMKSADFINWTPLNTILWIDSTDYTNVSSPDYRKQYYNMSVFKVGNDWWAIANMYRVGNNGQDVGQLPPYTGIEHTLEPQLLYSVDGINWQRTNDRKAFIPRLPGTMQVYGSPTIDGTKLYIYTIESERRHTDYENEVINGRFFDIWRYQMNLSDLESWKPGAKANVKIAIEGLINNFSRHNIRDTVNFSLRNTYFPYNIIYSSKAIIDSVTLTASFPLGNIPTGNYYIVINGRNILETWSSNPVQVFQSQDFSYDFTASASKAYGSNLILKSGKYCIYSGDLDQNDMCDLRDMTITYNHATGMMEEHDISDLNGDGSVDLADIILVNNNAGRFINLRNPE